MYEDSGLVFTDELGRPLNLRSVSQWFDRLLTQYEAIRCSPQRPRGRGRPTTPEALASACAMPLRAVELALAGPPLPPIRLHDLRHGAASLTYRATRDLKLVPELLGHSGIQITADTYTTLFQEVDTAAAEAVAALVPRGVHTMCAPCAHHKIPRGIPFAPLAPARRAATPPDTSAAEPAAAVPDGGGFGRGRGSGCSRMWTTSGAPGGARGASASAGWVPSSVPLGYSGHEPG